MDESLETQVARLLTERGLTLATAESCTGGLIAHLLTNVAGSSTFFKGCLVAYAYAVKEKILRVPSEVLLAHGAVSREVALAMARNARAMFDTDLALAVTGIAGPGGGTAEKPVGLTHIGLAARGYETAEQFIWQGDRASNKQASADAALRMVLHYMDGGRRTEDGGRGTVDGGQVSVVESDFLSDGSLRPRTFTWDERTHAVAGIGRQWIEGQRRHVLVMTDARETFELVVEMPAMTWKAILRGKQPVLV